MSKNKVGKERHNIYMPAPLYQEIKKLADEQMRSFNLQCVYLLMKAIEHEKETMKNE